MSVTIAKVHNLETVGWLEFPFNYEGRRFISKVSQQSDLFDKIMSLPEGAFTQLNQEALADLLGEGLSEEEIVSKLIVLNLNASHAVIELA